MRQWLSYSRHFKHLWRGIKQRWLIVFSEKAFERESKTLNKRITKAEDKSRAELKKLCAKEYSCSEDAQKEVQIFEKNLKYHKCSGKEIQTKIKMEKRGRPKKTDQGKAIYQISCNLEKDETKINELLKTKGKFLIATNELDASQLSSQDLLLNYKKQQTVERGFRFLKDPTFMTSSIFLKNEKRIIALSLIMCLCLLVYTLTQRKLRLKLKESQEQLPAQTGKLTDQPTMKWIYQAFEGVHVLYQQMNQGINEIVLNLNPFRNQVLRLMGPIYQKIYENAA